jgi:hypothetical protein
LPLLATWLQEWPEVDVVLTSTWRRSNLQSHLIDLLGPTVGDRVVGCTPWSGSRESPVLIFGQRQWEAEAWMASSWDPGRAWVALDDTPDLFEHESKHLVACDGRQGLAEQNPNQLSSHARSSGLTRFKDHNDVSKLPSFVAAADRFLTIHKYLKPTGSCLAGVSFKITLDREFLRVTIASPAFDSDLLGMLVTRILPRQHGLTAFRDDNASWTPPHAPYELRIRIGAVSAIELQAQVVLLSRAIGGGVAVRLSLL